jgi:hypothetical protein
MQHGRALFLLIALVPACGVPLWGADLRPLPGNDAAPVAVTVSAAAASPDLLRHSDQTAEEDSTLALRVHLHNGSPVPRTEDPMRYRLNVVGGDGGRVTGVAVAWREGELPSMVPAQFAPANTSVVPLPPGATVTLSVVFRGLSGLTLSGAARIELVLPDGRTVVVSAPAAPGPQWISWRRPRAMLLRAGVSWQGKNELSEVGIQLLFTHGPVVFGMAVMDHGALVVDRQVGAYHASGLGLFTGVLLRDWLGLIGGADGLVGIGGRTDGVDRPDLWLLRTYAAVRFQGGAPVGAGGGALPLRHRRPSPLRGLVLDLGYSYTFARGAHPDGGGLLLMAGAPLFAF